MGRWVYDLTLSLTNCLSMRGSMRAGFVTDAYSAGAPEAAILATTGHRSRAVMVGYRREANLFKQNAAATVGH